MSIHSADTARASDRGDKRERILDGAERVFAQRGFYNARVSEIAKEAGVADGTIYLYFKSKDDLLYSLFESRMERVNTALTKAVAAVGPASATEQLRAFVQTHLSLVKEQPHVAEVLTVELRQSSKFMKEYANPRFVEFLKILAGVIQHGQETREFTDQIPAPVAARAIFGMLDELAVAWLLGKSESFDIVAAADWIGALILSGLERRKK